jgi:DNA-binding NarL/FixJ family response regulator
MMHRIRILIAEGHPPLREALRKFLAGVAEVDVVGEAADGHEAVSVSGASAPDIALLDSGLPGMSAFTVTRLIKEASPNTKVIIFADEDSEDYWTAAQDSGASAYVAKSRVDRDLPAVIRSLLK